MNPKTEMAQIEQELANLRASFAGMQRGATYLKNFFVVTLIGSLLVTAYSLLIMSIPGIGVGAIVALMSGAMIVGNRGNWIYLADWRLWGERRSYVEATETMIRERESRLAEIKRSQA